MSEIFVSSSSNSIDKAINEYHDTASYNSSSSEGNTTDEEYTFSVPGVPLEVLQE